MIMVLALATIPFIGYNSYEITKQDQVKLHTETQPPIAKSSKDNI